MKLKLSYLLKTIPFMLLFTLPLCHCLCTMAQGAGKQPVDISTMRMSLNVKNKSVEYILSAIRSNTGLNIHYDKTELKGSKLLSLSIKNAPLDSFFKLISEETGLKFSVLNDKVIVSGTQKQFKEIKGIVRDKKGASLAGVSVLVKGTTRGVQTNALGEFTIAAEKGDVLVFSIVGYDKKEVTLGDDANLDITLEEDNKQLSEVVVTALGIKKQDRRIGYSVTQVSGEEVQLTREPTFVNALAGKVAGLVVQTPPNGPGGSTRILIRGNSSFANNQPLYVVDGIPITSNTRENSDDAGKVFGGPDPGDGLATINPDDIESITVLKGAAAGALYGNRAQTGVILITTKKGTRGKGLGISFNSNTVVEKMVPYDDLQYQYGRGDNGKMFTAADNISNNSYLTGLSWGVLLQGQPFVDVDGVTKPYVAQKAKDNFKRFFRTGLATTNSIALSNSWQTGTYRLSLSETENKSAYPNSGLRRYNAVLRVTQDFGDKIHTDFKLDLSRTKRNGMPLLRGDDRGSFSKYYVRSANTTDVTLLDKKDANGNYLYTYTNPYLDIQKVVNNQQQDRVLASGNIVYDITPNLHAQITGGIDKSNVSTLFAVYPNNKANTTGLLQMTELKNEEDNVMGLLTYDKKISNFSVNVAAGANARLLTTSSMSAGGNTFVDPTLLNLSNVTPGKPNNTNAPRKKVNSLFGSAQFGYNNYLFLELTARNDWSSSLTSIRPGSFDNSLFYPSANLSFVFTDALNLRESALSYGKLRASVGKVGSDVVSGLTDLTYAIQPTVNGLPGAQINGSTLPPGTIRPEQTTESEIGAELRFFNDRLSVDAAWYSKKTKDFLLSSSVSISTGFNSVFINAGSMTNKGVEILVTGVPVKTKTFTWEMSVNAAHNKNMVTSLTDQLAQTGVQHYYTIKSKVGYGLGSIFGAPLRKGPNGEEVYKAIDTDGNGTPDAVVRDKGQITYDANGKPVLDKNGAAVVNNDVYLGNGNPDWSAGVSNTFTYKSFSLSFLIDGQFGGQIYEDGAKWAAFFGNTEPTLLGRDGKYIPKGVVNTGTDANPNFVANTLPFSPYQQYNAGGTLKYYADEQSVFKKTFIKFRQISIGYSLPKSLLGKSVVKSVTFSLVGRNLFYIRKDTPIFDPESSDSVGNGFGFDSGGLPASRTYGFNLNMKF